MKTKSFQTLLKIWITIASLVAFLFGWIVLGHSGKPATANAAGSDSASQLAPLPTLAPLSPLGGNSSSLQPLTPQQSQPQNTFSFTPRFRTRGS